WEHNDAALIASYGDELQTYSLGFTSDQMQTLGDLYAASCMDEDLVKQLDLNQTWMTPLFYAGSSFSAVMDSRQ
ncbi:hypothetical protein Dimus_010743, partial [Dionaea muscipula]